LIIALIFIARLTGIKYFPAQIPSQPRPDAIFFFWPALSSVPHEAIPNKKAPAGASSHNR